jgi:opacity protein-like surface antigen
MEFPTRGWNLEESGMRIIVRLALLALLLSALPALARAAGLVTGVDGMTSTIMQQHQSSFSGLGVRARLHPARLAAGFELMPSIEYWRNSTTVDPFDIKTARKDATLGCDAIYHFQTKNFQPYLGAGFGIHFLSSEVNAPSLGLDHASDSVIKGGLAVLGGTSFAISTRFSNFVEVKYHHLPGFSQFKINWGLSYSM